MTVGLPGTRIATRDILQLQKLLDSVFGVLPVARDLLQQRGSACFASLYAKERLVTQNVRLRRKLASPRSLSLLRQPLHYL
jgi:hypothetical protein